MNNQEFKAAQQLGAHGFTSKAAHQHLGLRVFWTQDGEVKSAVLCRKHRNTKYRQFPSLWDDSEFSPADACEYCVASAAAGDYYD